MDFASTAVSLSLALLLAVVVARKLRDKNKRYHPVAGTFVHQLINFPRLHHYMTELACKYKTYRMLDLFKGAVYTADPANVEYVLKTNFTNYGKGAYIYSIISDVVGDGIFAVDGEKWQHQRKVMSAEFSTKVVRDFSCAVFKTNAVKLAGIIYEAATSKQAIEIQIKTDGKQKCRTQRSQLAKEEWKEESWSLLVCSFACDIRSAMSEKGEDGRDKAWKYTKKVEGERYFRCVFCNQVCSGTISRLKHHLAGVGGCMKACNKVPADVKKEYELLLKVFKDDKNKRSIMLREIGAGIGGGSNSFDSPLSEECGSNLSSTTVQPKTKGPLDRFVSSEPRQTVLNEAYKKELRKEVCRML